MSLKPYLSRSVPRVVLFALLLTKNFCLSCVAGLFRYVLLEVLSKHEVAQNVLDYFVHHKVSNTSCVHGRLVSTGLALLAVQLLYPRSCSKSM